MRRTYGSGHLDIKSGAFYVRWRAPDGRRLNRRVGKVRARVEKDGITRAEAGRVSRRLVDELNAKAAAAPPAAPPPTVDEVVDEVRARIEIEGARLSYRQNIESMTRVHVSPAIGKRRVDDGHHQGHRALGPRDGREGARAEDGAQRHDVPPHGVRVRGALGAVESGR